MFYIQCMHLWVRTMILRPLTIQVTPVGKFKLEEARGDKFYCDATRQLGGLHWTSFKGKESNVSFSNQYLLMKMEKVIEKDAKHLGSTKNH